MPYTDTIRIIAGNTANIALNAIPADTSVRLSSPIRRPTRNTISRQPRAGISLGYSAARPRPSRSIGGAADPVPLPSTFEPAMSLVGRRAQVYVQVAFDPPPEQSEQYPFRRARPRAAPGRRAPAHPQ